MEAQTKVVETESDPPVIPLNPSFESPLEIAFEVLGIGASVEAPAVAFDVKSLAKTEFGSLENPNDKHSTASKIYLTHDEKDQIDPYNLSSYDGKQDLDGQYLYEQTPIGVAMALSWTSIGGSTSYMETTVVKEGEDIGYLNVMGQVGEETYRSARIAYQVAHQMLLHKQPENTFFANSMLCLHLPRGNGTSAGCTVTTSLLSLAMKKPVRRNLAMTGKITLTGKILRVGGVKEKTIGARKNQVKTIIFPEANRRDFHELGDNVKEGIDVHFVDKYEQIFELAFGYDQEDQIGVRGEDETVVIDESNHVGKAVLCEQTPVGVAMGLATTSIGGLAIAVYIKTTLDDEDESEGCLNIRNKLEEGMGKNVSIAYTLAEDMILQKQPGNTFFADSVLSLYLPACFTHNNTSVGCTIVTSFLSLALKKPVRKDLAMTGDVNLTGRILAIGNVKEKTIAARRSQVKVIIFPEANRRDFEELAENVKEGLHVHFVDEYEQIFELAFGYESLEDV